MNPEVDSPLTLPTIIDERTIADKLDEILIRVTDYRSHLVVFGAITTGINAMNFLWNNIAFIEMIPRFKCVGPDGQSFDCLEQDFCGTDTNFWVDVENPYSLVNWSQQLGFICRPGWQIGLIGSVYFGGWCLTLLWLPQLSNRFGRKAMLIASNAANVTFFIVFLVSESFTAIVVASLLVGFATSARIGVGWPYLLELVPCKYFAMHSTLQGVQSSVAGMFGALFFWGISKDASLLLAVGLVLQAVSLALSFQLPESPALLIQQGRIQDACNSLNRLAALNGKSIEIHQSELRSSITLMSPVSNQSEKFSIELTPVANPQSEFFKQRWIVVNLISMIFIWMAYSTNYMLIAFSMKFLPGSIFLNQALSYLSELVGIIAGGFLVSQIGAKKTSFISFGIQACSGAAMLMYFYQTDYYSQPVTSFTLAEAAIFGTLILVASFGVMVSFVVCYSATTAMFPAQFGVTAFAIANFFARAVTLLAPQIAEIQSMLPMTVFTALSLLSMIASYTLQPPSDILHDHNASYY